MNFLLVVASIIGFFTLINAVPARNPYGQEYDPNGIWGRAPNCGGPGDTENHNPSEIWGRAPNRGGPGDTESYSPSEIWGREPSSDHKQVKHINMADRLPYPISPMTYTSTINDQDFKFNGTIQEAHAQIKALHPGFDFKTLAIIERSTTSRDLETRLVEKPICLDRFGFGNVARLRQGISYLRYQGGCSVGPTTCSRISCAFKSAIYLCNDGQEHTPGSCVNGKRKDNPFPIAPTCNELSDYVTPVLVRCWWKPDPEFGKKKGDVAGGQQFADPGLNFNVYVGSDDC